MSLPFYRAFEDRYRGARDVIKQRLRAYVPFIAPLLLDQPGAVALDLGCGRGEWLELLGEIGYRAQGIDLDDGMLAACRERGLDVETADALAALRARPDASVALVSAFHLVEHIPFELVRELVTEALRVLRPGGLLIMETPNPENLVVGASSFYMDPSHLRPLPPALLAFAAEHAGYARHKIVRLQEDPALYNDPQLGLINVLEGPSPDYSVVAQKAAAPDAMAALDPAFGADYGIALAPLAQRYEQQQADERALVHRALQRIDARVDEARSEAATAAAALREQAAQLGQQQAQHIQQAQLAQLIQQEQQTQLMQQAQQRLEQLEQRLQAAEARAEQMGQRVVDLLSSSSWRLTAPLRYASALARRLPGGIKRRLRAVLRRGGQAVLRRPALKRLARAALRPLPGLQARLYTLLLDHPAMPAALIEAEAPGQLSPRAARAYHELKQVQATLNTSKE